MQHWVISACCFPHASSLPFLDAQQILDRWWDELQRYQPGAGDEYIAIFDLNRDLPGKTFTIKNDSLSSFPKAYLTLDETIKKKYEKKACELFQQAILKLDARFADERANYDDHLKRRHFSMIYDMVKCLLEMARPASTS